MCLILSCSGEQAGDKDMPVPAFLKLTFQWGVIGTKKEKENCINKVISESKGIGQQVRVEGGVGVGLRWASGWGLSKKVLFGLSREEGEEASHRKSWRKSSRTRQQKGKGPETGFILAFSEYTKQARDGQKRREGQSSKQEWWRWNNDLRSEIITEPCIPQLEFRLYFNNWNPLEGSQWEWHDLISFFKC